MKLISLTPEIHKFNKFAEFAEEFKIGKDEPSDQMINAIIAVPTTCGTGSEVAKVI